jgi:putative hydrolase of the HAD superfamily
VQKALAQKKPPRTPRIISFDLDGTLVDRSFDDALWFSEIPKLYAKRHKLSFEEAKRQCTAAFKEVGDRSLDWYDLFYWFSRFKLGGKAQAQKASKALCPLIKPYPDAAPCLEGLKKRGFTLVLVSNASRHFLETKIGCTGLAKYFSKTFSVTSDFRKVKKSQDVYARVCGELGVLPTALVHVGDHIDFDYAVPRKLGIRAILIDRTGESNGDASEDVVKSLSEIAKIVP